MATNAIDNARAWFERIREMVADYAQYQNMPAEPLYKQVILDSPQSVRVRGPWASASDYMTDVVPPVEYQIQLDATTRIVGELSDYPQPITARLERQGLGTSWTDAMPNLAGKPTMLVPSKIDEILLRFASHFYFGG